MCVVLNYNQKTEEEELWRIHYNRCLLVFNSALLQNSDMNSWKANRAAAALLFNASFIPEIISHLQLTAHFLRLTDTKQLHSAVPFNIVTLEKPRLAASP